MPIKIKPHPCLCGFSARLRIRLPHTDEPLIIEIRNTFDTPPVEPLKFIFNRKKETFLQIYCCIYKKKQAWHNTFQVSKLYYTQYMFPCKRRLPVQWKSFFAVHNSKGKFIVPSPRTQLSCSTHKCIFLKTVLSSKRNSLSRCIEQKQRNNCKFLLLASCGSSWIDLNCIISGTGTFLP